MVLEKAAVTLTGGSVVTSTRREEVSARIRRALLTGELRPGQRIKEVRLAEALGVSRPTLRESLQQLIHEGALVLVPYKGVHVAQPTPDELRDVSEVRMPLETMAALRLARDPQGPAMDGVRAALQVHLDAIQSGDEVARLVEAGGLGDPGPVHALGDADGGLLGGRALPALLRTLPRR